MDLILEIDRGQACGFLCTGSQAKRKASSNVGKHVYRELQTAPPQLPGFIISQEGTHALYFIILVLGASPKSGSPLHSYLSYSESHKQRHSLLLARLNAWMVVHF